MTNEDEIDSFDDDDLDFLPISKEEALCLLEECKNSYISYDNPIARALISKLADFAGINEYTNKK